MTDIKVTKCDDIMQYIISNMNSIRRNIEQNKIYVRVNDHHYNISANGYILECKDADFKTGYVDSDAIVRLLYSEFKAEIDNDFEDIEEFSEFVCDHLRIRFNQSDCKTDCYA